MKTVLELLEEANLNFKVKKQPLYLLEPDNQQLETGLYGLVNNVTKATYAAVSNQYEVLQNEELAELATRLCENIDAKYVQAKSYKKGKNVSFDVVESEKILEYPEVGDIIQTGIKITNIHGGGSIKVSNQSLVLSCTNGMTKDIGTKIATVRHSRNMVQMLEDLLFVNEVAMKEQATMMDEIDRMLNREATKVHVQEMIQQVLEVDPNLITMDGKSEEYSPQKVKQTMSLMDSFKEEMAYKGTTVWGLLNGVTHYTSHKAGTDTGRETSKVFGSLAQMDKKAYDYALSLV